MNTDSIKTEDSNCCPDWTQGQEGIAYQTCNQCNARWYFRRTFCPVCGTESPNTSSGTGRGKVYAVTSIHRAPSEQLRPYAPYTVLLVDTEEGFRMMAHGESDLQIGDQVRASYRELAGQLIPFFYREPK